MLRSAGPDAIARLRHAAIASDGALDAVLSHVGVLAAADRQAVRELLRQPDVVLRSDVNRDGEPMIWLVPSAVNGVHRVGLVHPDGRVQHLSVVAS